MITQQLNRIELIGTIGDVRIANISYDNKHVANFSVATNFVYKDSGTPILETTWHHVVAFEGGKDIDFDAIAKGKNIHVIGRLKTELYTDYNNIEKVYYKVVASTVEAVPEYECNNGFIAEEKQ